MNMHADMYARVHVGSEGGRAEGLAAVNKLKGQRELFKS